MTKIKQETNKEQNASDATSTEPLETPKTTEVDTSKQDPKKILEEKIWQELKLCYDPEIPINIVDLGFIYGIAVENLEAGYKVKINMTLTTPGCAMGGFIVEEVKNRVAAIKDVKEVAVELVFDPPWDRSKMSMQAKLELGLI